MFEYPDSCRKLLDQVLEKLVSSKHFTVANADTTKNEYANVLQIVVKKNQSSFQDFQVDEQVDLDEFFMRHFEGTSSYSALVEIFISALILSHGQAAVEQDFSVNNILAENLTEETLIGQRIVLDHIRANNYNPNTVPLTRELLVIARSSHRTYTQKLAERKKEELKNKTSQQLESVNDKILALKLKKDLLEDTIAELKKDNNDTAFETDKQSKLELLFRSIAVKRVAIEKQVELDACLKEKRLIE